MTTKRMTIDDSFIELACLVSSNKVFQLAFSPVPFSESGFPGRKSCKTLNSDLSSQRWSLKRRANVY
jgi:hypothetical protein